MSGTFVEDLWVYFNDRYPIEYISVFGTFLLHELSYFGWALPFFIADFIPALQKYKIQPKRPHVTLNDYFRVLKGVLVSHITQIPLMFLMHWYLHNFGIRTDNNLESVWEIVRCCIACFFVEDFWFYFGHRFLHWGPMYQYIHKMHHENSAPFSISGEYAHPVEQMLLGVGTVFGPCLFAKHVTTVYLWMIVRLFQVIDCHSGYDFPWSLNRFLPFYGGAEYHDFHHETFSGNYASTFIVWDYIFGTDVKYRERRAAREKLQEKTQ